MVEVTLVGLKWMPNRDYDLHLLPDLKSPPLTQFLLGEELVSGDVFTRPVLEIPGVTVTYSARFVGAPKAHGVTLDTTTGEVSVENPLPPLGERLHSLQVVATAQRGSHKATTRIRVYVHSTIEQMWLTPTTLTLRKAARNMRFTVLARFDDGTIGDISNWSPDLPWASGNPPRHVHRRLFDAPLLTWSSEDPAVTVTQDTGMLATAQETGGAGIVVRRHDGQPAGALVVCAKPWTTAVSIKRVRGPRVRTEVEARGAVDMDASPNVLFLPDGFRADERRAFERLVQGVVSRLATNAWTRPFSYLRINYWTAWLPSRDAGVSVLNEVYESDQELAANGEAVRQVELPSADPPTGGWELPDLIDKVGLATWTYDLEDPVPIDKKVEEWRKLHGPDVTKAKMERLYDGWVQRGSRRLANERDTAFHMAFGDRPGLRIRDTSRALNRHPRRLDPADLNDFLDALKSPEGDPLPGVWTTGKDRDLVVVLCRSERTGGLNIGRGDTVPGRTIALSLGEKEHHVVVPAGGFGFDVVPDPIPATVNHAIWLTAAHELAHSWGLGDEYGELTRAPRPAEVQRIANFANLQVRERLLDAGDLLVADNIPWGRWPRIVKAGLVNDAIDDSQPGHLVIPLYSNQDAKFVVGDVVRLRTRPLATSTGHSGRFKVTAVDGDLVTVTRLPGTVISPGLFPAGSILMAPARADDPNPANDQYGDDLMLMTDVVRQRINLTHNPLDARPQPHDPVDRPCANVKLATPTRATNFPGGVAPKPPRYSAWTIGLYENGGSFMCGVYRPTGVCTMHRESQVVKDVGLFTYEFCLVCRYAIVDYVDPTRHGHVDNDYHQRYVRRSEAVE